MNRVFLFILALTHTTAVFAVDYPAFYIGNSVDKYTLSRLPPALQSLPLAEQMTSAGYVLAYENALLLLLGEEAKWTRAAVYSFNDSGFADNLTPALDNIENSNYIFNPAAEQYGLGKSEVLQAKLLKSEVNGRIRSDQYDFSGHQLELIFEDKTICDDPSLPYPVETHVSIQFNGQSQNILRGYYGDVGLEYVEDKPDCASFLQNFKPTFSFVDLKFIGDIDGDGKPDIIASITGCYTLEDVTLLSSQAKDGNLLELVLAASAGGC